LNILALRKNQTVEAGVEVSGTALAPQAKLVSTPNVPDTEKLSWLLFGRGLEGGRSSDFALLSAAASGLLGGQSSSLQQNLASALGVDEIGFSASGGSELNGTSGAATNTTQSGLLTVGKRLSSKLYVSYQQGLNSMSNLLTIRYAIVNRWSLQLQTGTDNAVDVFYTLSFD
jgi:translocation and assembly module TamB